MEKNELGSHDRFLLETLVKIGYNRIDREAFIRLRLQTGK